MRDYRLIESIIEEENLDCAILFGAPNLLYFANYFSISEYRGGTGAFIKCKGEEPKITVPVLEYERVKETAFKWVEVLAYSPYPIPGYEAPLAGKNLSDAIRNSVKGKAFGVDLEWTHYPYTKLINGEVIDISPRIWEIRKVKASDEIEMMKRANEITGRAFEKAIEELKEGVTEAEIASYIEEVMRREGDGFAFSSIVAFGENSAFPHHFVSRRKLRRDEVVLIDIGASYRGFCADSTRTFFFGKANEEFKRDYELVKEAQTRGIESALAGKEAGEVDKASRGFLDKYNKGKFFIHSTGHGIGVEVHEEPRVSSGSRQLLSKNMVITVEPGVYYKGKYGIRIEDMVIIGEKPITLEAFEKDLLEL
jgi:Xaa-Pro dipeptidase